jgi:hypothetical protein
MGHRNIFEVTGLLPGYRAGALVNRDHDEKFTVFKSLRSMPPTPNSIRSL